MLVGTAGMKLYLLFGEIEIGVVRGWNIKKPALSVGNIIDIGNYVFSMYVVSSNSTPISYLRF
jgi:hypothetical protein